jgi:hypothetical protein
MNNSALWYFESVNLYQILCPHKVKTMADTRQTVTTILNELKEKNLINFDRKKILIRDLASLK